MKLTLHLAKSVRADRVLIDALEEKELSVSRQKLKGLFEGGGVRLNEKFIAASFLLPKGIDFELEVDDVLFSVLQTKKAPLSEPRGCALDILFEDESILALNKLTGMPSLPHASNELGTAVNHAISHYPALLNIFPNTLEPGLLHRLDTGTSGALLFAKTLSAFQEKKMEWKSLGVKKVYRACVIPSDSGKIKAQKIWNYPYELKCLIGHDSKSSKRMRVVNQTRDLKRVRGQPQPAVTRIIQAREIQSFGVTAFDLTIEIDTGVMHQIRAHLSSIGFPLVGDSIYGGAPDKRLWLHAWKCMGIIAPMPADWPV